MTSITCPHGYEETDLSRCLDRMTHNETCQQCPIPVALIALKGKKDPINRRVGNRLHKQISCPWEPPKDWALEYSRYAHVAAGNMPLPCSLYKFYQMMLKKGCPVIAKRRRRIVLREVGFNVVCQDGIDHVYKKGESA